MRLDKVAFAVVLGLCTVAKAEENVFIDFSVLDNLNGTYVAPNEPLFPVLPKQEKTVQPKIKKAEPQKTTTEKVSKTTPQVEKTPEVVKTVVELPEKKEISEADIVVVDVEPVEPPADALPIVETEPTDIDTVEANDVASKAEIVTETASASVEKPIDKPAADEIAAENMMEEPVAPLITPTEKVVAEPETEEHQGLLIDEEAPAVENNLSANNRSIVFANGEDELNSEQMAQIDNIIGHFKDVNANKIAIYSYNLDDGVDSFRKKRISLNRAVGIRGYLIKQGYKNFSIKVININSGSDKINTVELEEI